MANGLCPAAPVAPSGCCPAGSGGVAALAESTPVTAVAAAAVPASTTSRDAREETIASASATAAAAASSASAVASASAASAASAAKAASAPAAAASEAPKVKNVRITPVVVMMPAAVPSPISVSWHVSIACAYCSQIACSSRQADEMFTISGCDADTAVPPGGHGSYTVAAYDLKPSNAGPVHFAITSATCWPALRWAVSMTDAHSAHTWAALRRRFGSPWGQNLPITGISWTSFEPVTIGRLLCASLSSHCWAPLASGADVLIFPVNAAATESWTAR
ncbi:hypothetical protein B6264_30575 (plasmid) [Kitasatospora aureofaciens]|nr:hypothetical protein B6264_30575 [Kitasatospora aureofaciens]